MFGVGLHFSLKDLLRCRPSPSPVRWSRSAVATALGFGLAPPRLGVGGGRVLRPRAFGRLTVVLLARAAGRGELDTTAAASPSAGSSSRTCHDRARRWCCCPPARAARRRQGGGDPLRRLSAAARWASTLLAKVVALWRSCGRRPRAVPWLCALWPIPARDELFRLAVLAIALGVAFGAAQLFGVSLALGAFFAGMVVGESDFSHQAAADALPLRDAFAVLFFVSVGMLFDPAILLASHWPVAGDRAHRPRRQAARAS